MKIMWMVKISMALKDSKKWMIIVSVCRLFKADCVIWHKGFEPLTSLQHEISLKDSIEGLCRLLKVYFPSFGIKDAMNAID